MAANGKNLKVSSRPDTARQSDVQGLAILPNTWFLSGPAGACRPSVAACGNSILVENFSHLLNDTYTYL